MRGRHIEAGLPRPMPIPPPRKLRVIMRFQHLVLGSLLVGAGLGVVAGLVDLVAEGIAGSLGACAEGSVAVLCHVLVGLLGDLAGGALDGLADIVCGVPERKYVTKPTNQRAGFPQHQATSPNSLDKSYLF